MGAQKQSSGSSKRKGASFVERMTKALKRRLTTLGRSFWLRGFSPSATYIAVNVTVTDVSELRKELIVSFTASELVEEETSLLIDFRKQAKVPGFRQGKVPENVLRQRFKKGISEELARKVSQKAFQFAVEDKDLKVHQIVDAAKLEEVDASQDIAVDFTVYNVFDLYTLKSFS